MAVVEGWLLWGVPLYIHKFRAKPCDTMHTVEPLIQGTLRRAPQQVGHTWIMTERILRKLLPVVSSAPLRKWLQPCRKRSIWLSISLNEISSGTFKECFGFSVFAYFWVKERMKISTAPTAHRGNYNQLYVYTSVCIHTCVLRTLPIFPRLANSNISWKKISLIKGFMLAYKYTCTYTPQMSQYLQA